MRFEIYPTQPTLVNLYAGTQWRWRLVADNGKTLASGESFHNEADCRHSIMLVMSTTVLTPIFKTNA